MDDGSDDGGVPDLDRLRARLYASDTTPADREAYDAAMAAATPSVAGPVAPEAATAPLPQPRRIRLQTAGQIGVALLVVGVVMGAAGGALAGGPSAPASASATRTVLATVPPLPTPVAARALPIRASSEEAVIAGLTEVLASSTDDTAVERAVQTIGAEISGPATGGDWMERNACSTSMGVVRASTRGRPVVLTPAGSTLSLPAQSHFRITVYLTKPSGWSWVLSAAHATSGSVPIAVGAGSPEAGRVQYAEFDGSGTGNLTRIEVSSTGGTPFLWQLDSCITGG